MGHCAKSAADRHAMADDNRAAIAEDVEVERRLRGSVVGSGIASEGAGRVPTIDMSSDSSLVAEQMWDAATSVGFFTVINHGVPDSVIEAGFTASAAFFAQPLDVKHAASPFAAQLNSGYEFMTQVRPSTGTADQKESIQITARAGCMEGRWPTVDGVEFEAASRALADASHELGCRILSLLERRACPTIQAGTLAGSHHLWGDDGQCTLRMLHYPPTARPEERREGDKELWRAGPHTDWCNCTLLYQLPGNEGLECAANPRAGQTAGWLTVDPVVGGIAVNIGDMLSRWSDGRVLSNLHRVRMPTAAECDPPRSRYSMAFFMQADKSALIQSESHAPITAGAYILGRIRSNFESTFQAADGGADTKGKAGAEEAGSKQGSSRAAGEVAASAEAQHGGKRQKA